MSGHRGNSAAPKPAAMRGRAAFLVVALALGGCEEVTGLIEWAAVPDTAQLYSLSRPDLIGYPAAIDFIYHQPVIVEQPETFGAWDVALSEDETAFQFLLPLAFQAGLPGPGLYPVGDTAFELYSRAPSEGWDTISTGVRAGGVYAFRTRAAETSDSGCYYYGKLEVIDVDPVEGSVTIHYVTNPNCNDRSVAP